MLQIFWRFILSRIASFMKSMAKKYTSTASWMVVENYKNFYQEDYCDNNNMHLTKIAALILSIKKD